MNIICNLDRMFETYEPWDCANSIANLGDAAGRLTWEASRAVAEGYQSWLGPEHDVLDVAEAIREHAAEYGAWDADELAAWDTIDCLAFMVQEIAADLRDCLDADNQELAGCLATYENTDWDEESSFPRSSLFAANGATMADFYTGT